MILTEFCRQKIGKIDNEIRAAENNGDFRSSEIKTNTGDFHPRYK
ncbi:hypothetical protein ACJDU8_00935 [Clostridium sp. WILCCON 0269]|uniref:Uncharacterized protein n=1 Tax=Candidatus Clostridium eludens TaxID=3381663 RepID=A0ABW8SE58_9CLOT